MSTMRVFVLTEDHDDHVIFFSSALQLLNQACIREKIWGVFDFVFLEVFTTFVSFSAILISPFLFCFPVKGVLTAEFAVLVHFKSVGIILFVFLRVVISLFAFTACKRDLYSHKIGTS